MMPNTSADRSWDLGFEWECREDPFDLRDLIRGFDQSHGDQLAKFFAREKERRERLGRRYRRPPRYLMVCGLVERLRSALREARFWREEGSLDKKCEALRAAARTWKAECLQAQEENARLARELDALNQLVYRGVDPHRKPQPPA